MLFFIKMKLSSRLCLTHKRVTQKYRNSTLIKKKKTCARIGSDRNRPILRIFWIGSDLKKWYRCIPSFILVFDLFYVKVQSVVFFSVLCQRALSCKCVILFCFHGCTMHFTLTLRLFKFSKKHANWWFKRPKPIG